MKPFIHLDIPYHLKPWKQRFDRLDGKQNLQVDPHELLEGTTLQFFADNGLQVVLANIWSWLPGTYPIWHIDQQNPGESIVAINYLLEGDPGQTEWIDFKKTHRVTTNSIDPEYGTPDQRFVSLRKPDFSESIRLGVPMMIRTDIPHRVARSKDSSVRWSARIFIRRMDTELPLLWDEAVEILGKYNISP